MAAGPVTFYYTTVRVGWADTDAAAVVWFGNFFKYIEAAEVALFDALGRPMRALFTTHQVVMPRTALTCNYRSPARFDDVLDVGLGVESVAERRVRYAFEIRQRESRQLVAEGTCEIACADSTTFKGRPFPDELRAVFTAAMQAPSQRET